MKKLIWAIFICSVHANVVLSQNFNDLFVKVQPTQYETEDYYIGKYAVTNADWKEFISDRGISAPSYWDGSEIPEGRERHPVLWVSAEEAETYCHWLSIKYPGWTFSLPTEAEWEFAAVGKSGYNYPWGKTPEVAYKDGILSSKFNYNGVLAAKMLETPDLVLTFNKPQSSLYGKTAEVCNVISMTANGNVSGWINHSDWSGFVYTDVFRQINDNGGFTCAVDAYPDGVSPWGAYNMCGNCWEWTSTIAKADNGAEKGKMVNVIKGGSWYATKSSCSATFKGEGRKGSGRYATVGIRVVARRLSSSGIQQPPEKVNSSRKRYYTIDGKQHKRLKKGVNIVVGDDGKATKVYATPMTDSDVLPMTEPDNHTSCNQIYVTAKEE